MLYGRPHHLAQHWMTYRRRSAVGDLFFGTYPALIAALTSKRTSQMQLRAVETRVDGYIMAVEDAQGNGAARAHLENLLASPLLFRAGA
jgi:hypothetical protein